MTRFFADRTRLLRTTFAFVLMLFILPFGFSEKITDRDFGFSLDIPEGFEVADYTTDGMSYFFSHPNIPVTLVMKICNEPSSRATDLLKNSLTKLSAKGDTDSFVWNGTACGISSFTMTLDDNYFGWGVTAPLKIQDFYVLLLCYAPANQKGCEQFIISTINSLCIDDEYLNTPGIITSYAFPSEGKKAVALNIPNAKENLSK